MIEENLTPDERLAALYLWPLWARPAQLAPTWNWTVWLILAGRGFGKTRTGAEWICARVASGKARRIALVGETAADARDVMVEGNSGILAVSPPWNMPTYVPSKRRLSWPNGAVAFTYSAEEPDQLRGPEHDTAWCDEIAKWRYMDTWDQLMFGLRIGGNPQCVATTTPRPIKIIRELLSEEGSSTAVTRGSTYDNRDNLAANFFRKVVKKYEGTRLGRQELNAEILDDVPGALWQRDNIDALRRKPDQVASQSEIEKHGLQRALGMHMTRITVNIDPAATSGEEADETGLTVTGLGYDGHGYLLEDKSGRYTPTEWGEKAVSLYKEWEADRIIAEVNNGGEMVENTIRAIDQNVSFKAVHASRGKVTRAEPISAFYEKHKCHHVGSFPDLEDQLCNMTVDFDRKKAGYSPDRLDSLVWGFTELMLDQTDVGIFEHYREEAEALKRKPEKLKRDNAGKVRMRAPAGVSTVFTRDGHKLQVGKGREVWVPETDVASLRRAGFLEVSE